MRNPQCAHPHNQVRVQLRDTRARARPVEQPPGPGTRGTWLGAAALALGFAGAIAWIAMGAP